MSDEYVTYLPAEAFDRFLEALNNPKPPSQALIDLMRRVPDTSQYMAPDKDGA